jgi:hypothetical protein
MLTSKQYQNIKMSFRPLFKKRDWVPSMREFEDSDNVGEFMTKLYNNPRAIQQLEKENMLGNIKLQEIVSNPAAIDLLEKYITEVDGYSLSLNPAAAHLFNKFSENYTYLSYLYGVDYREEENIYDGYSPRAYYDIHCKWENDVDLYGIALNPQGVDYIESNVNILKTRDMNLISNLCWNPRAIHLLEMIEQRDRNLLDFEILINNPYAVDIIERNMDKIVDDSQWEEMSFNENAVHLMRKNMDKIHWKSMSQNPSNDALKLLLENVDKIDWNMFNLNHNPNAIEFLRKHPDKINYSYLCENPVGIELYEEYVKSHDCKLAWNWTALASNTSIFILDTDAMKSQINLIDENKGKSFVQELMEITWHPLRVMRYLNEYNYDLISDTYIE